MTLEEYLQQTDQKPYLFAKTAKVGKDSVYKLINGGAVTYEVADRISKGTGGKVKIAAIYSVGRQIGVAGAAEVRHEGNGRPDQNG